MEYLEELAFAVEAFSKCILFLRVAVLVSGLEVVR